MAQQGVEGGLSTRGVCSKSRLLTGNVRCHPPHKCTSFATSSTYLSLAFKGLVATLQYTLRRSGMAAKKSILVLSILVPLCLVAPSSAQPVEPSNTTIDNRILTKSEIRDIFDTMLERRLKGDVKGYINDAVNQQVQSFQWILALLGLGGITLVVALVNKTLEDMVTQKVEERSNNITQALDFLKFNTSTTKIHLGLDIAEAVKDMRITQSITDADLEAILSYLRRIDPASQFRHTAEFRSGLLDTMRLLTIKTQSAFIDELFDKYQAEISQDTQLLTRLLNHYGQEVIGDGSPKDENSRSYLRFQILEVYAPTHRYPEVALAYRTLYESEKIRLNNEIRPARSERVVDCIKRSKNLTEQDQRLFLRKLLVYSKSSNWFDGFQGKNIETAVRYLFQAQHDAFLEVYQLNKEDSSAIATQGLTSEQADDLINRLF